MSDYIGSCEEPHLGNIPFKKSTSALTQIWHRKDEGHQTILTQGDFGCIHHEEKP
jgi:hypothetical protein